jgi:urease accessory protein
MVKPLRRWLALALTLALTASDACAHGAVKGLGDFGGGFVHPLIEPAHLVALIALALLVGQRGVMASKGSLIGLAAASAIGLLCACFDWPSDTDNLLLGAAAITGVAVMVARPVPAAMCAVVGAWIGFGIGVGTVPEGLSGSVRVMSLLGTWLGVNFCALCAATFIQEGRRPWMRVLVRVAASWMTACAVLVLALHASGRG